MIARVFPQKEILSGASFQCVRCTSAHRTAAHETHKGLLTQWAPYLDILDPSQNGGSDLFDLQTQLHGYEGDSNVALCDLIAIPLKSPSNQDRCLDVGRIVLSVLFVRYSLCEKKALGWPLVLTVRKRKKKNCTTRKNELTPMCPGKVSHRCF